MEKPALPPVTQGCLSCQYHQTVIGNDHTMAMICRKEPPKMASFPMNTPNGIVWANNILWPMVTKEDWCGAYEREQGDGRVNHERLVTPVSLEAS